MILGDRISHVGKQRQSVFPLIHRKVYLKYRVKKISSFDNVSWKNTRSKVMRDSLICSGSSTKIIKRSRGNKRQKDKKLKMS